MASPSGSLNVSRWAISVYIRCQLCTDAAADLEIWTFKSEKWRRSISPILLSLPPKGAKKTKPSPEVNSITLLLLRWCNSCLAPPTCQSSRLLIGPTGPKQLLPPESKQENKQIKVEASKIVRCSAGACVLREPRARVTMLNESQSDHFSRGGVWNSCRRVELTAAASNYHIAPHLGMNHAPILLFLAPSLFSLNVPDTQQTT